MLRSIKSSYVWLTDLQVPQTIMLASRPPNRRSTNETRSSRSSAGVSSV